MVLEFMVEDLVDLEELLQVQDGKFFQYQQYPVAAAVEEVEEITEVTDMDRVSVQNLVMTLGLGTAVMAALTVVAVAAKDLLMV